MFYDNRWDIFIKIMENFEYAKLSENPTQQEIEAEIDRLTKLANDYNNEQMAIKIFINSIYGACASPFFVAYNPQLAEAITLQGQDIIKFSSKVLNLYFQKYWKNDTELHQHLGITEVGPVINDVAIYGDTDSCDKNTSINTDKGSLTIEDLYNQGTQSAGETLSGHESVKTDRKILNYNKGGKLEYQDAVRVIRHKVSKPKWRLKTKTGKEIIITNDHSLIVFRDGKKIEVKPSAVLKTDKVLVVKK